MSRRAISALIGLALWASLTSAAEAQATTVLCDGQVATIVGTGGNDTLTGTDGQDVIAALQGDDTVNGLDGDDVICAGKGNDIVYGGPGFDIIFGAQGNDQLFAANGESAQERADSRGARMFGGAGDDQIHGSNKWDRMQGGPGKDVLFGYEGRDWIRGGADADSVDGGLGADDIHGGNGHDVISVATGDSVRGGARLDLCTIASEPTFLRSCGRNVIEKAAPPKGTEDNPAEMGRWFTGDVGYDDAAWSFSLSSVRYIEIKPEYQNNAEKNPEGFDRCLALYVDVRLDSYVGDEIAVQPRLKVNVPTTRNRLAESYAVMCQLNDVYDTADYAHQIELREGGEATFANVVMLAPDESPIAAVVEHFADRDSTPAWYRLS